ncbi:hypothetical protein KC960_03915 [Candidatus Saccharibacteria bacterium]|nr:hypothetical protein [Candidatus Saccharibacteria bacterium]
MSISNGLFVKFVKAQDTAGGGGGSGLSISPTRTELSVLPGADDSVTISLKNITSGDVVAKLYINDFEPDNNTGEPKLITDENAHSANSIASFVSGLDDVYLAVGESKDVTLKVSVPSDAAPGGYYGAIRFKAIPAQAAASDATGSEVSLTANLLSLVLIEVPGEITQKVAVNSIKTYLDDKSGTIFTNKPNKVGIEVENLGNSFIKPFGTVNVTDFRGKQIFTYELNDFNPRSNVLPNSKRVFLDYIENVEKKIINDKEDETRTSPIKLPGRYTITANVSYGNGGEVFTVKAHFWYIPSWLIVVLVVLLLGIVGLGFYLYRKYVTKKTSRR